MSPSLVGPLNYLALGLSSVSAALVLWYLIARPPLNAWTKLILLLGIAIFPIASALLTNAIGFHVTQRREFCGSCHVMEPYRDDVMNQQSTALASLHGRNPFFGERNCYVCHSDYGMYGTVLTKWAGLMHVWAYYTGWSDMPLSESVGKIKLYKPYQNLNCMQCHSTKTPIWHEEKEHRSAEEDLVAGTVSCASAGCHGPAHPFSKSEEERRPRKRAVETATAALEVSP